jgi:hypothetical protein
MLRIITFILVVGGLLAFGLSSLAQEPNIPAANDPSGFRALGRFRIPGDSLESSPDTFHVLAMTAVQIELPPAPVEIVPEATETPEGELAAEAEAEAVVEPEVFVEPQYETITTMTMWDLRGGVAVWSEEIDETTFRSAVFSPSGDTLTITSYFDLDDEDLDNDYYSLAVLEPASGEIITTLEDFGTIIDEPRVPGEVYQPLSVSSWYATDTRFLAEISRPLVGSFCSAWDVQGAQLVWTLPNSCGTPSPDKIHLAKLEPHASGSAYKEISIYNLENGEKLISSPDEVVEFQWLDDNTIVLYRPYGDPPVIWEITQNTRAVLENPFGRSTIYPDDALTEMLLPGGEIGYYVWDKRTGKVLRETEINGWLFPLDERMVVLEIDYDWSYYRNVISYGDEIEDIQEARERLARSFLLRDFVTGEVIYAQPHEHYDFVLSEDNTWAIAWNGILNGYDFYDLRTGEIWGRMPTLRGEFHFTQDMGWTVQRYDNLYTVWGDPAEIDRFENPPNSVTLWGDIKIYGSPSRGNGFGILNAGTDLWLYGQTSDGNWIIGQDYDGSIIYLRPAGVTLDRPQRFLPTF